MAMHGTAGLGEVRHGAARHGSVAAVGAWSGSTPDATCDVQTGGKDAEGRRRTQLGFTSGESE